jgi:hypothetical protein
LRIDAQVANKAAEAEQTALKMSIPLYRDRRERAAARLARPRYRRTRNSHGGTTIPNDTPPTSEVTRPY